MKYFDWDLEKNTQLKEQRDIGFEDILIAINEGNVLNITGHPNKKKYLGQKIFVVKMGEYVYLVRFVEDEEKVFLKTIIPSRKATKKYIVKKK